MEFDPKNIPPALKKAFMDSQKSALLFAEHFLTDPTQGTPFRATYPQKFILDSKKRDVWICVHRRAGKAQSIQHSYCMTPIGYKRFADLQIGDQVFNHKGTISKITHLHPQGNLPIYKITFTDDSSTLTTLDHNWTCRWKGRAGKSEWKTITTQEMLDRGYKAERERNGKVEFTDYKFEIPITQPVQFEEKKYNIDPYLLGALIGDGNFTKGSINIASQNGETIKCCDLLEEGYYWAKFPNEDRYRLTHGKPTSNCYFGYLRDLNLWGVRCENKFIPESYKYGSVSQRTSLLQGLFDTDGCARKEGGCIHFTTTSKQLSDDITFLVQSLGGISVVYKSETETDSKGINHREKWDHHIKLPEEIIPFRLERKLNRYNSTKPKAISRKIKSIEYAFDDEALCITIDHPDHLYLTDEFIVTHNCVTADTLVIDPTTLRPTSIARASKFKKTLCFDFESNSTVWADCSWIESGQKKCLKLKLGSGIEISLSDDHPVFDWKRGWVQAGTLKPGDRILAPSRIPIFGETVADELIIAKDLDHILALNIIPDKVFGYNQDSLRRFIAEFFFTRGRIHHGQGLIAFMLWHRELAADFRHLLIRFEVDSRIDEDGNLFIDDEIDRSQFMNLVGFDYPVTQVRSPRKWEIITETKKIGMRPVYDLCVEHPDHNFIGCDTVLHNSYAMTVLALWHAVTKGNQKICVFAPSSTQINEFFDVIDKWIVKNDFLSALQDHTGNHKNPQKRSFVNGSTIQGYLMGISGGQEAAKRGITADVIIIDEAQELDKEDWKVLGPIMQGDKFRAKTIRCYVAGTINDPTTYYYEKIYKIRPQEWEDRIFIPITQNKEYTGDEIEQKRLSTPPFQWSTEYLLEIAESDQAVFRKQDIDQCCQFDWEYGLECINESCVRFIGVDWDKVQAGTNIAVFQYDPGTQIVQTIYREEVPREQFTYTNAVNRIIEIYQAYQPELVIADQGQGEVQWELLHLKSIECNLGLAERLVKKAFNETIEVPGLQEENGKDKKMMLKPFLVGLLQQKFQENKFRFPKSDELLYNQLVAYHKVKETLKTVKFSTHNEHIIDCCLFAMYGIWWLYENLFASKYGGDHNGFKVFNDSDLPVDQFVQEGFWGQLDGSRMLLPGSKIPRTGFDSGWADINPDGSDFYFDKDDWSKF